MLSKEFIREFNNITISGICKDLGIAPNNVYSGKINAEDLLFIRRILEYKLKDLLLRSEYDSTIIEYQERKIEVLEDGNN